MGNKLLRGGVVGKPMEVEDLVFDASSTTNITSSSATDITGMTAQSFTVDKDGEYLVSWSFNISAITASVGVEFYHVIDGGSSVRLGEYFVSTNVINAFHNVALSAKLTLTAGTHTIKPQIARSAGSGTIVVDTNDYYDFYCTISG